MTVIIDKPRKVATPLQSCCTCATLLSEAPRYHPGSEKPLPPDRELECCPRVICGRCIHNNARFNTYCPYCQISQTDSPLPPGLKNPPSYSTATASASSSSSFHPKAPSTAEAAPPPPYTPNAIHNRALDPNDEKSVPLSSSGPPAEDILHFLNHAHDSVASLSLRYGVPASALRRANNITSDHLLLGRRTVVIPGEFYKGGVSLSPRPVEGEEEEARKGKIRRWMVGCKVHDYEVAVLYLEQAGYDLELAMVTYMADEEWEQTHPVEAAGRGKGIVRGGASGGGGSRSFLRRGR